MARSSFLFVFALFITSCGDVIDIPTPDDTDPVFGTDSELDGRNFSLTAGLDNYHMYPEFIDLGKDLLFKTTFKERDCRTDCPNSLSFQLYSNQPLDINFDIERALTAGIKPYNWNTVKDSQYVFVRQSSQGAFESSIFSYKGQKANGSQTATDAKLVVPKENMIELCLKNRSTTLGFSSQCQYLTNRNQRPPRVNLRIKDSRAITIVAEEVQPFDAARATFTWNTGHRGKQITLSKDRVIDQEICVTVSYPDQNYSRNCMLVKSDPTKFDLVSQFEIISFSDITPINMTNRGHVEIQYIDEAGDLYGTKLHRQSSNSLFKVYSSEDYFDEVLDMRLKKIKVGFKCELFGPQGTIKKMASDTTTLAIRYPG